MNGRDHLTILHLSNHSYEAVIVDTLLQSLSVVGDENMPVSYHHFICKVEDIHKYLDGTASIIVLTGFKLDPVTQTNLFQYLNVVYNVPFADVYIVGSMTHNLQMPSYKLFAGSDTKSAVYQFYQFLLTDKGMVTLTATDTSDTLFVSPLIEILVRLKVF